MEENPAPDPILEELRALRSEVASAQKQLANIQTLTPRPPVRVSLDSGSRRSIKLAATFGVFWGCVLFFIVLPLVVFLFLFCLTIIGVGGPDMFRDLFGGTP